MLESRAKEANKDCAELEALLDSKCDDIEDARMNLLWGVGLGCFFLLSACGVSFAEQTFQATLSEAFEDTDTLRGKLFIVALIVPSFAFWVSGYHWKLQNVRIIQQPGCERLDHRCRFLRILSNICFVVVAIVPHMENAQLKKEENPNAKEEIAELFARIHLVSGTLAFTVVGVAETLAVNNNLTLSAQEIWWRRLSISTFWSCSFMFVVNKVGLLTGLDEDTRREFRHWAFRFEVCIAAGFMWMNQVVWCFSDPDILAQIQSGKLLQRVFPYPHVAAILLIVIDLDRCGLFRYTIMASGVELIAFSAMFLILYPVFEQLFICRQEHQDTFGASSSSVRHYGSHETATPRTHRSLNN